MSLKFHKYQNCGNDFIIIDNEENSISEDELKALSRELLVRKYGVGADNVLFLIKQDNHFFMRIYNTTDIEGSMCGNGSLCVMKYLNKKYKKDEFTLKTIGGEFKLKKENNNTFSVNLGKLQNTYKEVKEFLNTNLEDNQETINININKGFLKDKKASVVSLGEPHLIIFDDNIDNLDMKKLGDEVNSYKDIFPKHINLTIVSVINNDTIKVRFFERGCFEETDACGTGSSCAALVSNLLNKTSNTLVIQTKGGSLKININNNEATLFGKPKNVFNGQLV